MVVIRALAKYQCQRSVGSKARVETNGQTDTPDRITFPANAAGKKLRGPIHYKPV